MLEGSRAGMRLIRAFSRYKIRFVSQLGISYRMTRRASAARFPICSKGNGEEGGAPMRYQYVLNTTTRRLHLRIDGMSDERCNLDQLKDSEVMDVPPRMQFVRCARCMPPDGSTPVGPVLV